MKRLRLSREALNDLDEIWDYTAETWGPDQANRYLEDLRSVIEELPEGKTVSQGAEDTLPGARKVFRGRHVVFFRDSIETIDVIRVLHQQMDAGRWV
ncbi:type II toxin-antitoxin system RelE/ParE family toxin [Roseovarius aestuarii]|uniref:Toxin n=1 Tax=Roseovarius aestuarii TaxID=475083 RepID=A0A1X7BT98_9RHOB|nr:type II toxin-antitoxin system RelE/ParE family toxin [Roseovarius aestuarii]SMC12886.1 Toxin ParE1 [Roseovarius aestuarii]